MSSPRAVTQDPTLATQKNNSSLTFLFDALHSLLRFFNLQSLIRLPGRSNSDPSTIWSFLQILIIGLVADFVRRNTQHILAYFSERFSITAPFNESDPCYEWVLVWLSKQPNWKSIRTASISTVASNNSTIQSGPSGAINNINSPQTIYTIPEINKIYWIRTKLGYWVCVSRRREGAFQVHTRSETEYVLHLRIMTFRDANVLYDLIDEARETYVASRGEKVRIFSPDQRRMRWKCFATCTKRSLSSVILEESVKEKVVSDVQEFLKSRNWYTDRGIPYRRGYLFYGKPGTGKTSFINALAGELGLDIYNMSSSTSGLDDVTLAELVNHIPDRALLVMEDIDAAFVDPSTNRSDWQQKQSVNVNERRQGFSENKVGHITLSGLLNILDGVGTDEGRILVATTNYYDRLDEALRRPGRIDLEVKFTLANKYQAREQFRQFYVPQNITGNKETGIILAKAKSQSLVQASDQSKGGTAMISLGEKYFQDKDLSPNDLEFTTRISQLADRFIENFQEHVISSASLQQYLLMYKSNPTEAVAKFKTWIEAEIDRKQNEVPNSEPLAERQGNGHPRGKNLDKETVLVQVSEKSETETATRPYRQRSRHDTEEENNP